MLTVLFNLALAWTPTEPEAAMVRAFSARDGAPPCAEVEALVPDPATSLEAIVDHVSMPPWAGMHAAACLIERHSGDRRATLLAWTTDPARKGLARLVFNRLHLLQPDDAELVLEGALAGPLAADARAALVRSPDPALRERAVPPSDAGPTPTR